MNATTLKESIWDPDQIIRSNLKAREFLKWAPKYDLTKMVISQYMNGFDES